MTYCEVVLMGDHWAVRRPLAWWSSSSKVGSVIREFSSWREADAYARELNTAFTVGQREGRSE